MEEALRDGPLDLHLHCSQIFLINLTQTVKANPSALSRKILIFFFKTTNVREKLDGEQGMQAAFLMLPKGNCNRVGTLYSIIYTIPSKVDGEQFAPYDNKMFTTST